MVKCLLACLSLALAHASQWAVLVAGSNDYWNYRHQADMCHAYQLLIGQGLPQDHIIVLSANDVAYNSLNPFPGHIYNSPGTNPPDVFPGCRVDYNGTDNNVTNFLAVLTGNETWVSNIGTGRVLQSGPNDTVFLYYVDHGAPGLIAFPDELLFADEFMAALEEMHAKGMYGKLVIFLEACYGGSMFDGLLPSDIGIYAITAANDTEPSWGIFCPPDAYVDGVNMYTPLGDMFSVHWMDIVANSNLSTLTMGQLYTAVAALTNESHVMEYGDMSVTDMPVGAFLGFVKSPGSSFFVDPGLTAQGWSAYDSKYQFLSYKYLVDPSVDNANLLIQEIDSRLAVTSIFTSLTSALSPAFPERLIEEQLPVTDFDCLRAAIGAFQDLCQPMDEFSLKYINVLKNACEEGFEVAQVRQVLGEICQAGSKPDLSLWG